MISRGHSIGARPQWPFTINRASRQFIGLDFFIPGGELRGRELIKGYVPTVQSDAIVSGAYRDAGLALKGTGANGCLYYPDAHLTTLAEVTLCGWLHVPAWTSAYEVYFVQGVNGDVSPFQRYRFGRVSTNNTVEFAHSLGTGGATSYAVTPPFAFHFAWAIRSGSQQGYINGVRVANLTVSGAWSAASNDRLGVLGSPTEVIGGRSGLACMWDVRRYTRFLTEPEIRQIYDPRTRWELYQAPRRLWIGLGAAAGHPAMRRIVRAPRGQSGVRIY